MGQLSKITQIFELGWKNYIDSHHVNAVQYKAGYSICNCKSKLMGFNTVTCSECGFSETHYNSCHNRNCPNCQVVDRIRWVDKRKSEVIDSPYFHMVFTVPSELYPLFYKNQRDMYSLLHKCVSETILELSLDKKFIGGTPGIIQVLHTWGQELNYHPHIHCIVSGGCLSPDKQQILYAGKHFYIPVRVMSKKFRGKLIFYLKKLKESGKLELYGNCKKYKNSYDWNELVNKLYSMDWVVYTKETFNKFGNAIEYLGKYTHRVAISNKRIQSFDENGVTFSAKDYRTETYHDIHLSLGDFIGRICKHVLPAGFQKIRYYGFLNNRYKNKNLELIFRLQNKTRFKARFEGATVSAIMKEVYGIDIMKCPCCGKSTFRPGRRIYPLRE